MAFLPVELVRVISFLRQRDLWLGAAPLLRWLALMGIMYVATTFSNAVWLSQGKVRESIGVSVAMCCTIIVAITIGVRWGMEGICIALLIRSVAVFPLYVHINYRLTGIARKVYYHAVVAPLIAGVAMAGVLVLLHRLVPGDGFSRNAKVLLAGGICGTTVYAALFFFLFRQSFLEIIGMTRLLLPTGLPN